MSRTSQVLLLSGIFKESTTQLNLIILRSPFLPNPAQPPSHHDIAVCSSDYDYLWFMFVCTAGKWSCGLSKRCLIEAPHFGVQLLSISCECLRSPHQTRSAMIYVIYHLNTAIEVRPSPEFLELHVLVNIQDVLSESVRGFLMIYGIQSGEANTLTTNAKIEKHWCPFESGKRQTCTEKSIIPGALPLLHLASPAFPQQYRPSSSHSISTLSNPARHSHNALRQAPHRDLLSIQPTFCTTCTTNACKTNGEIKISPETSSNSKHTHPRKPTLPQTPIPKLNGVG